MKTIKNKTITIIIGVLFITSNYAKAQDTVRCLNPKYHWTESCNNYGMVSTLDFVYSGNIVTHDSVGNMLNEYIDKTLTRQIFFDTIRRQVYGIAGTTIECHNPNGCYFYLYKKIGNTFVVLDSAEWTHRNIGDSENNYIEYNVRMAGGGMMENFNFPVVGCSNSQTTLTLPDSNIVQIHEAYFKSPVAVEDTFYIGSNWNGIAHYYDDKLNSFVYTLENPYTSIFITPVQDISDNAIYTTWFFIHANDSLSEVNSPSRNCFFPIMEPLQCAPINVVSMDSLTTNSVYISWEQSYMNTYYQIEYGPRGFQHGSGVFIDSVATTNYALQNLAAGTEYIAYVRSYCSMADTVSGWNGVQFKTLHTECPAVEDLAVYEGTRIASIDWKITDSEIAFCQIEWGEAGFEHGSGTVVNNIHDTTYMLRNLTPNTAYDVYIRTYCERSQVFGAWQQVSFTTNRNNDIATIDGFIDIELHPNPTSGVITLSRTDVMKVEVIDAVGKTIMVVANNHVLDLSKLAKGYYTLRITLPEGVAIRKVIRK